MEKVSEPVPAESDSALAADLAAGAGRMLVELRAAERRKGTERRRLGTLGDKRSQEYLLAALRRFRPGDAVLSEESADNPSRCRARRVWILDPLDGTREYSEGRPDWAVHVALWETGPDGGGLTAGALALPAEDVVLATGAHHVPPRPRRPVRIAVSRTRAPSFAGPLAREVGGELVPLGSAGYKAAAVIRGEADAYVHAGGQYEWDSAAPVAVATGLGLHASRVDGSPLSYNQADPYLPDLLLCRPELAGTLLTALRQLTVETGGLP
jgi:3'(2'), 5'-bisphosphate nucleotidase